jgi:hypothetical protein
MKTRAVLSLAALSGLAFWACAEQSDPGVDPGVITGPAEARVPAVCSTRDQVRAARSFFANPEQRAVIETLRSMEDACVSGEGAVVVAGGWGILGTMEAALDAGTEEDVSAGADLANGLFDLMCEGDASLCAFPPEPVLPGALDDQGTFAVRDAGTEPILARGLVPFVGFEGADNDALWVLVTTGTSWSSATRAGGPILIHGQPASFTDIPVDEMPFQDLAYELNSFPNVDGFNDGELHVGTCFGQDVVVPHLNEDESLPTRVERLQREGTILSVFTGLTPTDCDAFREPYESMAFLGSTLDGILAGATDVLFPSPLYAAAVTDRRAPLSSGTPIDFSIIAPVAASPQGRLVFVDAPQDGNDNEPLPTIRVQALSGGGTPMERVAIQLVVAGNEGEPAGASFCPENQTEDCGDIELTIEELDGFGTLAEFNEAQLNKPGGYRICAVALDSEGAIDFSFEQACSGLINIKN